MEAPLFTVPEEYKDFVTNADDLLRQIHGSNEDLNAEMVEYYIFFDDFDSNGEGM